MLLLGSTMTSVILMHCLIISYCITDVTMSILRTLSVYATFILFAVLYFFCPITVALQLQTHTFYTVYPNSETYHVRYYNNVINSSLGCIVCLKYLVF